MQAGLKRTMVVMLVAAALFSVVQQWLSTLHADRGGEAIATWEARLVPARKVLPLDRGVIGYVGDWDVPGIPYALWDQESEYLLTQYALAPLILKKGMVAEWNVAVLKPKTFAAWQAAYGTQFEVLPVGRSVYVLHRLGSQ